MDKITGLLSDIATKLGTTVEHLWGVLIRQAPIDGLVSLVQYALIIVWVFVACKITRYFIKVIDSGDRDESWWAVVITGWAITSIFIIAAFFSMSDTVAAFINPEYWALEHVLNKIAAAKH